MFKKNHSLLVVLFLGSFVFLNLTSVYAAEISRDARKHMIRGQAAMEDAKNASDYQDAVKEFKKAVEYAPHWADAWFNLGVAQERAMDYAGAIESFNQYLKLNPDAADRSDVEAKIFKLGYLVEKKAKVEKAEGEKKKALNLYPELGQQSFGQFLLIIGPLLMAAGGRTKIMWPALMFTRIILMRTFDMVFFSLILAVRYPEM